MYNLFIFFAQDIILSNLQISKPINNKPRYHRTLSWLSYNRVEASSLLDYLLFTTPSVPVLGSSIPCVIRHCELG